MQFSESIRTPRLLLRKVQESDANDMFEYTSNETVTRFLSWYHHTDIIQTKNYISALIKEYELKTCFAWGIELFEIHKFIGIVRLFDISYPNKRGEISFIMNPTFQGRGFISEAINAVLNFCFNEIQLNRVQARCATDNISSERVMRKLRMNFEGTLKEYWQIKGEPTDARIYAITKLNYTPLI